MIEAGIPVARIWQTPIPQHLKKLVQERQNFPLGRVALPRFLAI